MTVIAWDGKHLAADKRGCSGTAIRTVTKIKKVDGVLVGLSGDYQWFGAMINWIDRGRKPEEYPLHQRDKDDWCPVLVIERDGTPSFYERSPFPIRIEDQFVAIGSGRDFAMAALHLGHTAVEAVDVACKLDSACGNGVDVLSLAGLKG